MWQSNFRQNPSLSFPYFNDGLHVPKTQWKWTWKLHVMLNQLFSHQFSIPFKELNKHNHEWGRGLLLFGVSSWWWLNFFIVWKFAHKFFGEFLMENRHGITFFRDFFSVWIGWEFLENLQFVADFVGILVNVLEEKSKYMESCYGIVFRSVGSNPD